ncbi:MAG: UDP-2,3-diacylglucosamine diphosphatase [bacterium]|jgi:UDP-2,3-diacylglucosamine pyrophosphatase LpxH
MTKRPVEILVLSDIHLGTYGCHAKELLQYLKSVKPGIIILNGDIIDIWQFSKKYFPESHMKVLRKIMKFVSSDTPVYYLTGNHDELLRKFADFELGSLQLKNKLLLNIDGKKAWIFHGDVFDVTMQYSKWLAKLGAIGYDSLIHINTLINWFLQKFGKEKMSLSKKIKNSVKNAVKFINDFENTAAEIAIEKGYDFVICGHIHQPEIKKIKTEKGEVTYLNSGDWIENLSALEYNNGEWSIFDFRKQVVPVDTEEEEQDLKEMLDVAKLYQSFVN